MLASNPGQGRLSLSNTNHIGAFASLCSALPGGGIMPKQAQCRGPEEGVKEPLHSDKSWLTDQSTDRELAASLETIHTS